MKSTVQVLQNMYWSINPASFADLVVSFCPECAMCYCYILISSCKLLISQIHTHLFIYSCKLSLAAKAKSIFSCGHMLFS